MCKNALKCSPLRYLSHVFTLHMAFPRFAGTIPPLILGTMSDDEMRRFNSNAVREMCKTNRLWLKPCFFRFENKDNRAFTSVVINGSQTSLDAAEFWKTAIIEDMRALIRQQMDPSVNYQLHQWATDVDNYMEQNNLLPGWETLNNDLSVAYYGMNVRTRIDRMLPLDMSFIDLYTFVDRLFFNTPRDNTFVPIVAPTFMAEALQDVMQDGPAPSASAIYHIHVDDDYSIDGVDVDARSSSVCLLHKPGTTAVTIRGTLSTHSYDMVMLGDSAYRNMLTSRAYSVFQPWNAGQLLPMYVFCQLVSAYVAGIAEYPHAMLLRHVTQSAGGEWECRVGIGLQRGTDTSFPGVPLSVRTDPWRILCRNITCNNATRVIAWERIPRFTMVDQYPLKQAMQYFLANEFVSATNMDIDSVYTALYQESLPSSPMIDSMKLAALWRSTCAMYDSRAGRFKKNMQRLAMKNRSSVGEIMSQVASRNPIAYGRALDVFLRGQAHFSGGGDTVTVYSTARPVATFDKLLSAAARPVPVTSEMSTLAYVRDRLWEHVRRT